MARLAAALILLLALPSALSAQADSAGVGLRVHFPTEPMTLHLPPALQAPWSGMRFDSVIGSTLDSVRRERAFARRQAAIYGNRLGGNRLGGNPLGGNPLGAETDARGLPRRRGVFGLSEKYADLSIDGNAVVELRAERFRNFRCTAADVQDPTSGCRGGIKPPQLENRINARSSGLIGQRVHVNVDYDSERDFGANNNIQVYYQGLEDEIVRRVEVGTVTFRPPPSRFLTAAIPSNNFGVNATFELGPLQFQALAATQKGSALARRTYIMGGSQSSQPQDRQVRDLDFESGRFFWVIDPRLLPAYPQVDILNVDPAALPPARRPVQVRVYQYRAALVRNGIDPNLAGLGALARNHDNPADTTQVIGSRTPDEGARWRLLIQGTDYYLDRSGTWFTLTSKLDPSDYLAVSYTTSAGTTVGTFPAQDNPQAVDSLELITRPNQDPSSATFLHEMRQVYRVAGADLDPSSLQVGVSLNRSERPSGGAPTYLALFGLSLPTDPNVFDRENRLFPRSRDPSAAQIVRESYIVFPTLQPFGPTPGLAPGERSDSLYRTPQYLLLSQGPPSRFQLRLRYNASGGGDRSTLVLNAAQIKEGSEELTISGRPLVRGVDYSIDYATGRVTFLNPNALFGTGTAQVSARFEQQDAFAIAPTSILGFTSRYSLGERGAVNLVGLMQREATAFNRPQLGFEAKANLLAGANTELHFKPSWITRGLNKLISTPSTAPSLFDLNAEVAFSRPDPNRSGAAYLEGFEGDVSTQVTLNERIWNYGSRPQRSDGLELIVGPSFDPADAVQLTWQNLIPAADGKAVVIRPQDIDTSFKFAGSGDQFETAMFLTLHADTSGGLVLNNNHSQWTLPARPNRPRWRSMVLPLSTTGLDLSRSEYLEFWVFQPEAHSADSAGVQLVFDLGSVNEDALALAPLALTTSGADSVFTGRQYVGQGRLDSERSRTGIFNAELDDTGILSDRPDSLIVNGDEVLRFPELCNRQLGAPVPIFPWGDLSSRCTVGNGYPDSEDLDGDLQLNATGPIDNVYRYIVPLAATTYQVPNRGVRTVGQSGREAGWTLYRVPLRVAGALAMGSPNIRLVKQLRITVVGANDGGGPDIPARFAFARMRFIGAPWVRRTETPIAGFDGATAAPHGEVVVSVISTENRNDLGYVSPPGVVNATARRDVGQEALGQQINEKSLRVIGRDLKLGERAEGYLRFPAGAQNLLNYNELRVWTRGRGTGWDNGDLEAFIKVGSDPDNFYLYHAPASTTSWEPEMVIDLSVWRRLRADIEGRYLRGDSASGAVACGLTNTRAYAACEGPYVVAVANPGVNPPNLAAIQEVAGGIYRAADHGSLPEAELWIDDIRLASPVSETGRAVSIDGRLVAADVGDLALSYVSRGGQFRQLAETPTYQTTNVFALNTSWRLDRFLPPSLGLALPATMSFSRSTVDPQLLSGTDLRGADLAGLRRPESWSTTYTVQLRRTGRGRTWLVKGFIDPLTLAGSVTRGHSASELSEVVGSNASYSANYNLVLQRTGPRLSFGGLVGSLPRWFQTSEIGKALRNPRFSLAPTSIRLASGLTHDEIRSTSYLVPIARDIDTLLTPALSLSQLWRNSGGLTWQPLGMLTASADLLSTRDLRNYPDSTPLGRLAGASRRSFAGIDAGVERDRNLTSQLAIVPRLSTWLQPRYIASAGFVLSRTLTSRPPVRLGDDTTGAFILPQTLNNSQSRELGASVDLVRLGRVVLGDSSALVSKLARIRPLDLSTRVTRISTFDLAAFEPSLGYQLALGGMENFLSQNGVSAIGASEVHTRTATSGADLPFGVNFTLQYSLNDASYFQLLGSNLIETRTMQREWPVGSARWNRTFRKGLVSLVEVGATFRQRSGTSTQPAVDGGSPVTSLVSSSNFSPDLRMALRNGMQITARISSLNQSQVDNGTDRRTDQGDFTAGFLYTIRLPAGLSRVRKPLQSSLTYTHRTGLSCVQRAEDTECISISDVRTQELRGTLRTDVLRTLTGSLDLGYKVDDARHLDRKTGNLYMLVSFNLSLFAGDYR